MNTGRFGFSGSTLKLIALITMVIDHVGASVIDRLMDQDIAWKGTYDLCRSIGRIAFPIYCFLLVEGFLQTRSVARYARNLFLFALISEIPFNLALYGKWFQVDPSNGILHLFEGTHQNVFFTLLLGLLMLAAIRLLWSKEGWKIGFRFLFYPAAFLTGAFLVYLVSSSEFGKLLSLTKYSVKFYLIAVIAGSVAVVIAGIAGIRATWDQKISLALSALVVMAFFAVAMYFVVDYNGWGILVILAMYALRGQRTAAFSTGCILLISMKAFEWSAMFGTPFVALYNGKRGLNVKYFFYLIYPLHFVILYLVCILLKIA